MRYLAVVLALFAHVLFSTHGLATGLLAQTDAPIPQQGGAQDEPAGVEGRSPYATPGGAQDEPAGLEAYEHPGMTLEAASRNSAASQEVNKNLNNEFANYVAPSTGIPAAIFVIAIIALVIIDGAHSVSGTIKDVLFRFPPRVLSWGTFWDVVAKTTGLLTLIQFGYCGAQWLIGA